MKILWHFNSYRHFEEYYLSSQFFNKSEFFKNNAHVLVTCNNENIDIESLRKTCAYDCKFDVVRTTNPRNGVHTGQLVALAETYHRFNDYDFIVHTTPDVYLVNDGPLIALLEEELHSDNHMIVDHHPYHPHCEKLFSTDFFVFKPKKVINFFGESFDPTPSCHCIEAHLFKSIHEKNIPHKVICRGRTSITWQVDELGLIHNHDKNIIKNILYNNIFPDESTAFSHNYFK